MRTSRGERPAGAATGFFSSDRGAVVRLVVTLLLGACALVGPRVGHTGADFTHSVEVPATFRTAPTFGPPPAPGDGAGGGAADEGNDAAVQPTTEPLRDPAGGPDDR
ncbi:hypothetical protein [Cellulomonas persica]|uniref:Lipoprotein n=1 Tax=Cellulomonas persica TaxID=76861 RepID=A0A510URZ2_9CELL|nr:hypothetical protein [Cellulomonas persica]GEK17403.1 hypothetical protein CPE01_11360 [Cellulomonas persica]